MPARELSATHDSRDRVLAPIQGEHGKWSAWIVPTPAGWRAWLTQGGVLGGSHGEAVSLVAAQTQEIVTHTLDYLRRQYTSYA